MKNFEFKSQICTSRSQSERLLSLGLKKETADMMYITDGRVPEEYRHYDIVTECYESCLEDIVHIPAWSLHRLIELYSDVEDTSSLCIKDVSYKLLIFCIEKAIHCGFFNQDYLEEKK